jgi:hypothetical protein
MTVKERIHQLMDALPEDEVLDALERLEQRYQSKHKAQSGLLALDAALKEMADNAPQNEKDNIPPDFSERLDHYIYGNPKR